MNALRQIQVAGVTLNSDKCVFGNSQLKFLGHLIDKEGDPEKVKAIRSMQAPSNVPELRRYMGMVNQLAKFTLHLAEITKPLTASE